MKQIIRKTITLLSLAGLTAISHAADTDIIDFEYSGGSNILFVMDMSGSMEYQFDSNVIPANPANSRLGVLHSTLKDVLNDPTFTGVNIGISSFAGYITAGTGTADTWNQWGHGISYPVSSIDADADTVLNQNPLFAHQGTSYLPVATVGTPAVSITTRGYIGDSIPATWTHFGGTPIVDALHEAALYFRGESPVWGNFDPSDVRSAHPSTYTGLVGSGAVSYNSPITKQCSNNAIVLLSDGRPTLNSSATQVASMIGSSLANNCQNLYSPFTFNSDGTFGGLDNGRCGPELAEFLATNDNSSTVPNDQFVKTHTIGVALNASFIDGLVAKRYLKKLATKGGGEFVNANTPEGLASALKSTITLVSKARAFTAPTYTPDLSSLLTNSDDVYLPVFDRSTGPVWPGNLKKFKRVKGQLVDADGIDATNSDGALKDTAKDFWAAAAGKHAVKSGGAASQLDPSDRDVYTDAGATTYPVILKSNELKDDNTAITTTLLGNPTMTATRRTALIEFIRGNQSNGDPRNHMGDIIHSKPVHLAYGTDPNDKVIFVGTNEGYLHAINDEDGSEVFAFMPEELLKGIETQYLNDAGEPHLYGVDGPITLWHDDKDGDKIVDSGEEAILYFGLRRGGKSYYALDVSDRENPKLLWKINNSSTGFSKLGYTWSQPVRTMMKFFNNASAKPVLVFGGGFIDDSPTSTDVDGANYQSSLVFIVNAKTGKLIWKSSFSASTITPPASKAVSLKYAVPARVRALDTDQNGSLDRLFYGDTGGNIWRVDFQAVYKNGSDARIMHFANLGTVSSPATSRRMFFAEPDVALLRHGGKYKMSVAVGSGERPKPLDFTGDDHFFVMFDKNPARTFKSTDPAAVIPAPITISELVDATTTAPVSNALTGGNKGWYTDLVKIKGEKVLTPALTYNNMVMFSTLGATTVTITACGIKSDNYSRFYALDILTGGAVLDLDESGSVTSASTGSDASIEIGSGVIPGRPQILFNPLQAADGSGCVTGDCIRPEEIATGGMGGDNSKGIKMPAPNKSLRKVFWLDKE